VFWGLDSSLAYKRHFPAVNWLTSYSLYADSLASWFNQNVADDWYALRGRLMGILQEEAELEEIVKLVGMDALSAPDRLKLEVARSIREDYLHQNAFHETDTYTSLNKQLMMMRAILSFYDKALAALQSGASIEDIVSLAVREKIGRFKYVAEEQLQTAYDEIEQQLEHELAAAIDSSAE
jgi:V/A-type H+-transporting ATPase subunit A